MDPKLIEVAKNGNVDAFYALLGKYPSIVDEVDKISFIDTPLHCAASAGHTSLVKEIINLKPSYILKLNQDGFSPLHLASKFGRLEIVKVLLEDENGLRLRKLREAMNVDGGLCNLKGREELIPLHCAAIEGHTEVLEVLLSTCPKSIKALTVREESVLHLAVKFGKFEAFEVLLSWLRKHWYHDILSQKDQGGNTILHLAISQGQDEIVKVLLLHSSLLVRDVVQVNARNTQGLTALDLLMQDLPSNPHREEMKTILSDVGAKKFGENFGCQQLKRSAIACVVKLMYNSKVASMSSYFRMKVDNDTPSDARNALLVIVVLIATATYQTGISPPGGYWDKSEDGHFAGETIWSSIAPITYNLVMLFNFAGFMLSLVLAYNLTLGFPMRGPLLLALVFMLLTYSWSTPIFYNGPARKGADYLWRVGNLMLWLPVASLVLIWAVIAKWMEPIWWKLSLLTGLWSIRARGRNQRATTGSARKNADGILDKNGLDRSGGDDSVV